MTEHFRHISLMYGCIAQSQMVMTYSFDAYSFIRFNFVGCSISCFKYNLLCHQARPLFKDRRKFGQMADPKLQGQFPVRGLFQALAVAAMCLHEQAASRPLIADVVTALNFLASQTCDPSPSINMPHPVISLPLEHARAQPSETSRQQHSADSCWSVDDCSEENGTVQSDLHDKQDNETPSNVSKSPTWRVQMDGKERARAIAEARIWGEACRERKAMSNMEKGQMKEVS
ncbi:hypothetical protein KP509_29G021700 [Ceratopteris richardii]|uniref:Uncharacterized protein n=1 Tax=Ceratopteris richardii TaxID=49495 RepID=A0A8T2R5F3_CERRI|nr:hypothetical protein KP509_29G021700 [Ceratopteris richardii]